VSAPRIEIQPASTAPELLLDETAMVVSRHQQRFIDGIPWSLPTGTSSSSPLAMFPMTGGCLQAQMIRQPLR